MLAAYSSAILTAEDVTVLQFMLNDPALLDQGKFIIRQKLARAQVVTSGQIPGVIATINSRITYRMDNEGPVTAFLVDIVRPLSSSHGIIPLRSVIGLSVLGLREGDRSVMHPDGNGVGEILLKRVLHQPQRELQAIFGSSASTASWAKARLLHLAELQPEASALACDEAAR